MPAGGGMAHVPGAGGGAAPARRHVPVGLRSATGAMLRAPSRDRALERGAARTAAFEPLARTRAQLRAPRARASRRGSLALRAERRGLARCIQQRAPGRSLPPPRGGRDRPPGRPPQYQHALSLRTARGVRGTPRRDDAAGARHLLHGLFRQRGQRPRVAHREGVHRPRRRAHHGAGLPRFHRRARATLPRGRRRPLRAGSPRRSPARSRRVPRALGPERRGPR